jgi:hypothetical protein
MLRNWKMKLYKIVTSISCNNRIQQHFPFYYRNRYMPRWRIQLALGICLGFLLAVLKGTSDNIILQFRPFYFKIDYNN